MQTSSGRTCQACGAPAAVEARFCATCGAVLGAATAAVPPPPPPAAAAGAWGFPEPAPAPALTRPSALSRTLAVVALAASAVLLIDLFLPWQRMCVGGAFHICASLSGFHGGLGVLVGLLILAHGVWEAIRLAGSDSLPGAAAVRVGGGLGVGIAVLTALTAANADAARYWPVQGAALVCAVVVGLTGAVRLGLAR